MRIVLSVTLTVRATTLMIYDVLGGEAKDFGRGDANSFIGHPAMKKPQSIMTGVWAISDGVKTCGLRGTALAPAQRRHHAEGQKQQRAGFGDGREIEAPPDAGGVDIDGFAGHGGYKDLRLPVGGAGR